MNASPTLREWLREGHFTLTMSSGFFGFFAHAGALAALESAGLTPARVTGSSAGALVTGMSIGGVATDEIRRTLHGLRRGDFWDPAPGAGVLRGARFRAMLDAMVRHTRVEDCPTPGAFSVFDLTAMRTRVIDRGDLTAALHASCAVPVMFHPVWIDGRPCSDGGIADRAGLAGAAGDARVLHHHLAARSPWRRAGSRSIAVPQRAGLTAVVLDGLPRVHPFALDRGPVAYARAHDAMLRALDQTVRDGVVRRDA